MCKASEYLFSLLGSAMLFGSFFTSHGVSGFRLTTQSQKSLDLKSRKSGPITRCEQPVTTLYVGGFVIGAEPEGTFVKINVKRSLSVPIFWNSKEDKSGSAQGPNRDVFILAKQVLRANLIYCAVD